MSELYDIYQERFVSDDSGFGGGHYIDSHDYYGNGSVQGRGDGGGEASGSDCRWGCNNKFPLSSSFRAYKEMTDRLGKGFGDGRGGSLLRFRQANDVSGIREIEGYKVYYEGICPNTALIFQNVHGNVAKGYIVRLNTQLVPCYMMKREGKFAYGETPFDTLVALKEQLYYHSSKFERFEAFMKKFPEYDFPYSNVDLVVYYHIVLPDRKAGFILTDNGLTHFGAMAACERFLADHGLSLNGATTVREFLQLTKEDYNDGIVQKLVRKYEYEMAKKNSRKFKNRHIDKQ